MLIAILTFILAKFLSVIFFQQIWSQTLQFGTGVHHCMVVVILMFVFSKVLLFI